MTAPRAGLVAIALIGIGLGTVPASADPIALPNTRAILDVPAGWTAVDAPSIVAAYRNEAGHVLAVTRAQVPNPDAWRPKTRDAYVDQIERGIAAAIPKYRRLVRTVAEINGIPALDLEAKRADGATIVIRVLLFRTYALALAIELPAKAALADARAIAKKFLPPPVIQPPPG